MQILSYRNQNVREIESSVEVKRTGQVVQKVDWRQKKKKKQQKKTKKAYPSTTSTDFCNIPLLELNNTGLLNKVVAGLLTSGQTDGQSHPKGRLSATKKCDVLDSMRIEKRIE